jgi:hypothetical protein
MPWRVAALQLNEFDFRQSARARDISDRALLAHAGLLQNIAEFVF